jgi:hypothetical protein
LYLHFFVKNKLILSAKIKNTKLQKTNLTLLHRERERERDRDVEIQREREAERDRERERERER